MTTGSEKRQHQPEEKASQATRTSVMRPLVDRARIFMANAKTGKTPANVSVDNAVHYIFFALCCAGYRLVC